MIFKRSNLCTRWQPPDFWLRGEVVLMTTYEALSLMITFGMFILALLAYIDRKNKWNKV